MRGANGRGAEADVTDLAATFLRSLREALSRGALQLDATVVSR